MRLDAFLSGHRLALGIALLLAGGASLVLVILLATATSPSASDGWYLLIPPRSEYNEQADFLKGYKILDNEPLSTWGQQGAYDSAWECEAVRNTLTMAEQRVYSLSSEDYQKAISAKKDSFTLNMQRWVTEKNNANVFAFIFSRCIRRNDPRLRPRLRDVYGTVYGRLRDVASYDSSSRASNRRHSAAARAPRRAAFGMALGWTPRAGARARPERPRISTQR